MPRMHRSKQHAVTFKLTDDARYILDTLARKLGISMTSVVEIALRDRARIEELELPDASAPPTDDRVPYGAAAPDTPEI